MVLHINGETRGSIPPSYLPPYNNYYVLRPTAHDKGAELSTMQLQPVCATLTHRHKVVLVFVSFKERFHHKCPAAVSQAEPGVSFHLVFAT